MSRHEWPVGQLSPLGLALVLQLLLTGAAAVPGTVVSLLPTGTAQPIPSDTAPAAEAITAAAYPAVQAIPTSKLAGGGGCAVTFAAGQQCGGNMSNPLYNCSGFSSCTNVAWVGGCCAGAGISCAAIPTSGTTCWSCGGQMPARLEAASRDADAAATKLCTRLAANGDFDYGCVLGASMLFYEAQRSGKLPPEMKERVPWRGDSALRDKAPNGASLVGGWYDAGDLTRFTFPAAFTISTLALSLLEFEDAYSMAGQTDYMLANLRWGADWLNAAHYQPNAFVAVTWMPGADIPEAHLFWGKPEEVRGASQVRALVSPQRGADLLGQGAAALAAVAAVFKERDAMYSQELLETAKSLYDQATDGESDGLYSNSVPEVRGYYTSYSYIDDKAWAAAWLALATGDADLLSQARFYYDQHMTLEGGGEGRRYDYNNLIQAVGYLLAKQDPARKDEYSQNIRNVMNLWLNAQSNITYTEKGMAYIDSWGNLRYVANQAFMGLLHNKLYPNDGKRKTVYTCFARKQARIMLGESGPSYVTGVGNEPPCRPHHRAASCPSSPDPTQPCDCTAYFNEGCNPNTLYGALVGGPNQNDEFGDLRWNYEQSEVALDWNAGFTGMLAGLAASDVTWDQCKAAGQEAGRGAVSPALSAAGQLSGGGVLVWHMLLAAGVLAAMLALQPGH